jgi:predicted O-linked N-acetylglucosamine transferase (SPINDLY family)
MGVTDLIARNRSEYIDFALKLANDRVWAQQLRKSIARASDSLYSDEEVLGEWKRFIKQAAVR